MGRLHAIALAEQGATVAILDVNEEGLTETSNNSNNIKPYNCDVTDLEQVRATVKTICAEHGPIDRFINCAAIMPGGTLMESSAELLNKIMTINYGGMINVFQTVIPDMLARNNGDIIIYGSTAGIVPLIEFGGYGSSKSANNFYTKVLIEENKDSDVRIMLVCPPGVDTPLLQNMENRPASFDTKTHKKMVATPEDVVKAVERSLERGKNICYPGSAKFINLVSRFMR